MLSKAEQWETGLMPVVSSNLVIHALDRTWQAKTARLEAFNELMSRDVVELTDEDMERTYRFPQRIETLDNLASVLFELAAPKIVDAFLRTF